MKILQILAHCYMAFRIEGLLKDNKIMEITISLIIIAIFAVVDDIAAFAFLSKKCSGPDSGKVGLIRQIGVLIGQMFAFYLFVPLNSAEFCQRYLGMSGKRGLLKHSTIFSIFAGLSFIGLLSVLSIKEKFENKVVVFLSSPRIVS